MKHTDFTDNTQVRLLEAAGELFAQKGFNGISIRQITNKAKTNVAAVNYYFKNKQNLYEETVLHAFNSMDRYMPLSFEGLTPTEQLYAYIEAKLQGFLGSKKPDWHLTLIHDDRKNASARLLEKIGKLLHSRINRLARIIVSLTGLPENDDRLYLYAFSITGQCLFFGRRGHLGKNSPKERFCKPENIKNIAGHIYRFSMSGMGLNPDESEYFK